MTIRISHKKHTNNIVSLDLSKVTMLHQFHEESHSGLALAVTMVGTGKPLYYDNSEWVFQQVQVSMAHKVSYVTRTIPEIVTLYEAV